MKREQYDDYVNKFNNRDYDGFFDFYGENPRMSFFGVEITNRTQLKEFYGFLHTYVKESITVLKFASSDDFLAIEAIVRVEGIKTLDKKMLEDNGYGGFFPIVKGQVQEMKQYIHYHLEQGKFLSVGCAIPLD